MTVIAQAPNHLPHYMLELREQLQSYLQPNECREVERAFVIAESAHRGQTRHSGEPYITHPVAVARILADMHMDAETLIAAVLHDTLEDSGLQKSQIAVQFNERVADLVDGVTKLDKFKFENKKVQAAESFRKMVMAMSRDLRVILIKLADRLHNMRTLDAKDATSRRRIARETLEVYAPIAGRLGINRIKSELQDHGFRALYPRRYRLIDEHAKALMGNRREPMTKILNAIRARLEAEGIKHRLISRIKSPFSIYEKMRKERKSFAQVTDVYGFRITVPQVMECYHTLGAVHALYKPVDSRFKDFIAIPKSNGYQSLHTVLFGPFGAPIEVQIRTEEMDAMAERGVAAHWIYKTGEGNVAQTRAREWLKGLLESQQNAGSSIEFLENVKVDLFPDEVYLFSPKGKIFELPRNACVIDFAYAVHTSVGDHAVAARVDGVFKPLRTKLVSGQTLEIITAASAAPSPGWLEFAVTAKARTAIRHHLKQLQFSDAVELGHRMLSRSLEALGSSLHDIPTDELSRYLHEHKIKRMEDLLTDLAYGNKIAQIVARQLASTVTDAGELPSAEVIRISGLESGVVSFSACCHPINGDPIVGILNPGKGLVIHHAQCPGRAEWRKYADRIMQVAWDAHVAGSFRVPLRVEVVNKPGVLAAVAGSIADANCNIDTVVYKDRDTNSATLMFTVEVADVKQLDELIKRVTRSDVVQSVQRVWA
jgi:GTP diphosphokinase / guanosine-3',5'-bis(diphosphate) 3'-diphosphatase